MIKNSILGIALVCGVFSISMIGLWILAVGDWQSKMEQPKGIAAINWVLAIEDLQSKTEQPKGKTAINPNVSTTTSGEYILQKKGFLTDFQIYDFISDCHQLKGKLKFDRIYSDRGTFYDLRCKA
jgi:hypothetical protein